MTEYRIALTHAFTFHAAHTLPWHPGKCARLHGHSYRVEVRIDGPLNENGIVIDFDDLEAGVQQAVIDPLDHSLLNDRLPNPTAELLAIHIMEEAARNGIQLTEVRIWETPDASAVVAR